MIAVWYGLVTAAGAVDVVGIMPFAEMGRGTVLRIGDAYFNNMLVYMISVGVMEMTVVKIVDMVTMTDGRVATIDVMLMLMTSRMLIAAIAHRPLLLPR